MEKRIYLDFETRSRADIKKVGAAIYAEDASTDIMCLGYGRKWATDDRVFSTGLFTYNDLHDGFVAREIIFSWIGNPEFVFVAHNAFFERMIWHFVMHKKYGYPDIPIHRWRCTMAKAYAHSLPGNLEWACKSLGLTVQKDKEGHAAMLTLCKPDRNGNWVVNEQLSEIMHKYCKTDVDAEYGLDMALPDLSPAEQAVWQLDQRINTEGITLDIPAIRHAVDISEQHQTVLRQKFKLLTGGAVESPTQRAKFAAWLDEQGVKVKNTQKATLLKAANDNSTIEHIKNAINVALEANKTSISKYRQMLIRSKNSLMREMYQYHGAHTGRWAGRGVQWHNLARPKAGQSIALSFESFSLGYEVFAFLYGNVAAALSHSLRGSVIAKPMHRLLIGDLAQGEARVLAWLAGQEDKLDMFRRGVDLYCEIAGRIYGRIITKKMEERQTGKVADLALGFQGGIGAFANMAKSLGLDLVALAALILPTATPDEIDKARYSYQFYVSRVEDPISPEEGYACDIVKQRWRIANPKIVQFWKDVEQAAIMAVSTGQPQTVGRITWFINNQFLYCKLPSGRLMAYPYYKIHAEEGEAAKLSYMGDVLGKWVRIFTYGGKLVENIVQAVQRDLLAGAMLRVENKYPVCFHTHDEMVAQVKDGFGSLLEFTTLMAQAPRWAPGLPIAVDGTEGKRYGVKAA